MQEAGLCTEVVKPVMAEGSDSAALKWGSLLTVDRASHCGQMAGLGQGVDS